MSKFAELFPNVDPTSVKAEMEEAIQANVVGWEPRAGNLDDWINTAKARLWFQLIQQASAMGAAAFGNFGRTIANVPPILAAPATVTSTWTTIDEDGHTIEDGTEVKVSVPGRAPLGFVVVGDVAIAPGDDTTAAGEVLLQAIEPGVASNGLTGEADPISTVVFVDTITLVGATSGGVDAEDEDAYLDRLTEALQLLSLSPIVQRDFEIDARTIPGIARAVCLPGYNPLDDTTNNALMFATAAVDVDGVKASAPMKEALLARQTSKVPSGVVPRVFDPTYTKVDVTETIKVLAGYDPVAVEAAVEAMLIAHFSPENWGLPEFGDTGSSAGWVNRLNVYINELISLSDRVAGVERVVGVVANRKGLTLEAKDFNLLGRVALPEPWTIVVSAV